jgi:acyl-CoA hydrolase
LRTHPADRAINDLMNHDLKYVTVDEALKLIHSGDRIFVHGSAATPTFMLNKLAENAASFENVEVISISVFGDFKIAAPGFQKNFQINSLFVSAPLREAVKEGRADYLPVFLSEIPDLFRNGALDLDVALVQVSVPDKHGYVSLGTSVDIARAAVNTAKKVIAHVNPQMPRTHGDGMIHVSEIDAMIFYDTPIHEMPSHGIPNECEIKIGQHIAGLIEDRSTLQMGIGTIPDAVLSMLTGHKDLGVHTEMFSDGIIPLLENGIITNKYKKKHPGRTVTGFCTGTRKLYDYVDDNPAFAFLDIDYVNDTHIIRQNPKVIAINSCIEIDYTGQVCSDAIGMYQYSGVGGQMDFMRGAALSEGGKPIIALPSRTGKGIPRIVPVLKQGASVVTTRAHVHYVVTEYGVANLFGKNLRQRALALINIAHPDDREQLERGFHERFGAR